MYIHKLFGTKLYTGKNIRYTELDDNGVKNRPLFFSQLLADDDQPALNLHSGIMRLIDARKLLLAFFRLDKGVISGE